MEKKWFTYLLMGLKILVFATLLATGTILLFNGQHTMGSIILFMDALYIILGRLDKIQND